MHPHRLLHAFGCHPTHSWYSCGKLAACGHRPSIALYPHTRSTAQLHPLTLKDSSTTIYARPCLPGAKGTLSHTSDVCESALRRMARRSRFRTACVSLRSTDKARSCRSNMHAHTHTPHIHIHTNTHTHTHTHHTYTQTHTHRQRGERERERESRQVDTGPPQRQVQLAQRLHSMQEKQTVCKLTPFILAHTPLVATHAATAIDSITTRPANEMRPPRRVGELLQAL